MASPHEKLTESLEVLRALQERTFERVGGSQQITTNARVIAATNRDLMEEVKAGRFREDLVYRLNVVNIHLPALRERKEDIPLLAEAILEKIASNIHKPTLQITDVALEQLMAYRWPGNVRELENILTQAMVHARGKVLTPDLLSLETDASNTPATAGTENQVAAEGAVLRTLDEVEAEHVQRVLLHTNGHKGNTSRILGISRPALDRKIAKYNLNIPEN